MTLEEEKEEAGHDRDCGANWGVHMNHPSVISSLLPIGKILHNQ
jgi:hypothetical protein